MPDRRQDDTAERLLIWSSTRMGCFQDGAFRGGHLTPFESISIGGPV